MAICNRRTFLRGVAAGAFLAPAFGAIAASSRPNILWITCEDTSAHLGCYGDAEARTPNLDRLASEGVRHTRAFPVSAVCAPSRSCLITGMYPTTLGTCHMRCKHAPPADVRCFPAYLRRAGYYCTNNAKTDYQFDVPPDAWDESSRTAHWRNRPDAAQPFFAVFNFTTTHESQIGNLDSIPTDLAERIAPLRHDPERAKLPPYYPDTPLIRRHWAHYYDTVSAMDAQAGDILRQLEEDGLADNTLVFFFSDHGAGLPRAKRWMYDSGLHAPLIVRWPGRLEPGTVSDRLVSFIDFAPTVLAVAGVPIPDHMQGTPFLGDAAGPPRQYVFAARDRMDERYDLIRAVRDARYKYIRNYEPRRPYAQYLSYCESWPVMQEMRRVQAEGGLTDPQKLFFRAVKPVEELYDTEADPNELHNLADSPEHRQHLDRLRAALDQWLADARDIGFIPESELERWLPENPTPAPPKERPAYAPPPDSTAAVFGRALDQWLTDLNSDDSLRRIRAAAALGVAGPAAEPVLRAALRDPEVCVVHWAAAGLANNAPASPETLAALEDALGHSSATARVAAASALCALSRPESAVPVLIEAMAHPHFAIRLRAIETLSALDPKPAEVLQTLNAALEDDNQYVVRIARHGLGLPPKR